MRKNIYELIAEEKCDPFEEIARIEVLFEKEPVHTAKSLKAYINREFFRALPIRGTSLNIDDLKERLGILKDASIDSLLMYCELIYNILYQAINAIRSDHEESVIKQSATVLNNMDCILEQLNHETTELENKKIIVVEKSKQAALAASLIDDPEKALKIIEYNHVGLKGNLLGKQTILKQIADILEPKYPILRKGGYGTLESDSRFLANNFHIRHNNKEGKYKNEYIAFITDTALEDWYDKAYESFLMAVIAIKQISISSEIEQIKQSINGNKESDK